MRFTKYQALGNDYIVIMEEEERNSYSDLAQALCDRHYGPGADGIAVVTRSRERGADFSLRIFNADGSEAAMSGNGSRSAAAHLIHENIWQTKSIRFSTLAGPTRLALNGRKDDSILIFESEMGVPEFTPTAIPILYEGGDNHPPVDYPVAIAGMHLAITALRMCNPNCCVFVNDFSATDWRIIGGLLETDPLFPERTNVVFVRVLGRDRIEVRIWERGVGETLSSGTGACAAVVASNLRNRTDSCVTVLMPGGEVEVKWRADGEVLLTGPVQAIYRGELLSRRLSLT